MKKLKNYIKKKIILNNIKNLNDSVISPCFTIHNVVPDNEYINGQSNIKESFAKNFFESIKFPFHITADDGFLNDYIFLKKLKNDNILSKKIFIVSSYFLEENVPWWRVLDYLYTEKKYGSKLYKNLKLLLYISNKIKHNHILKSFSSLKKTIKYLLNEEIPEEILENLKSKMLSFISYEEINKTHKIEIDLGIHTLNHPKLSELDYDSQFYEINESLNFVKNNFKSFKNDFAIPFGSYGSYNKDTIKISKELDLNCYTNHIKYPLFSNNDLIFRINIDDSGDGYLNSKYI